jgi:GH35 family endo-1,4-beta-xylanase
VRPVVDVTDELAYRKGTAWWWDLEVKLKVQARIYHDIFVATQEVYTAPVGVTVFGISDRYSWLNGTGGSTVDIRGNHSVPADGLLYGHYHQRKPAFSGVLQAILDTY